MKNPQTPWRLAIGLLLGLAGCDKPAEQSKPVAVPSSVVAVPAANPGAVVPEQREPQVSSDVDTPSEVAVATPESVVPAESDLELKELGWDQLQELVASHQGKVVVVDIWSTACEPCLREFPRLVALQQRHPDDVVCISFDCDYAGVKKKPVAYYRERVMKALVEMKAKPVINVMSTLAADELFEKINLDSIPAVYVYDRSGKLSQRFDNRTPASETEEGISYELQIDPLVARLVTVEKAKKN